MAGKICLIQRGENYFCDKVKSCMAGGGIGAIIFARDDQPECEAMAGLTLRGACIDPPQYVPTIGITRRQGAVLRDMVVAGVPVSAAINIPLPGQSGPYGYMSGTSMSTPHAAAVAALVWSAFPLCTNSEVRAALQRSALDLGTPGRDVYFGYGLVQARAARDYLAANRCRAYLASPPRAPAPRAPSPRAPPPRLVSTSKPPKRPPPPRRRPPPKRRPPNSVLG